MKTNSNSYTIIYSVIIVVIVAFLLAFVSSSLKATQDANVALDTQKQILNSLNLRDLDNATAAAKYKEVVKAEKEKDGMKYYECEIDGQKKTVYSVKGMGLWGGISGFIAVDADNNTIYGVYFNHEGETAGLGAEIKDNLKWQQKFQGKKSHKKDQGPEKSGSFYPFPSDPSLHPSSHSLHSLQSLLHQGWKLYLEGLE